MDNDNLILHRITRGESAPLPYERSSSGECVPTAYERSSWADKGQGQGDKKNGEL